MYPLLLPELFLFVLTSQIPSSSFLHRFIPFALHYFIHFLLSCIKICPADFFLFLHCPFVSSLHAGEAFRHPFARFPQVCFILLHSGAFFHSLRERLSTKQNRNYYIISSVVGCGGGPAIYSEAAVFTRPVFVICGWPVLTPSRLTGLLSESAQRKPFSGNLRRCSENETKCQ